MNDVDREATKDIIREHIEDMQRRMREQGITHIRQWKPRLPAKILLGKMLVRPVEGLDIDAVPTVKLVYLNLKDLEWQIREIMNREGGKGIAMLQISIED